MTTRERLTTALDGGTPDITPFSIYSDWIDLHDDSWRRLIDEGLGAVAQLSTVRSMAHGLERTSQDEVRAGRHYSTQTLTTPVGTLRSAHVDDWQTEWFVKTDEDYKTAQWIVEHTELAAAYEGYERADAQVGDRGLAVVTPPRSPAMAINLEWAGTERFCIDLALEVPELFDLYEAMKKQFIEYTRLVASGPGRFVDWNENLTVSMLGRDRYRQLLMPVYSTCVPILADAGKRVLVHYDGALSVIADLIAETPLHGIESLTEPPEGDMTYDECRAAWPDKVFWGNINVGCYALPPEQLRQAVVEKRNRAGKRGVAFEISEDLPPNWKSSIPLVLETLRELA